MLWRCVTDAHQSHRFSSKEEPASGYEFIIVKKTVAIFDASATRRPNMRMQSDAAPRPQDQADFGTQP
jgi:hypothetical protein